MAKKKSKKKAKAKAKVVKVALAPKKVVAIKIPKGHKPVLVKKSGVLEVAVVPQKFDPWMPR